MVATWPRHVGKRDPAAMEKELVDSRMKVIRRLPAAEANHEPKIQRFVQWYIESSVMSRGDEVAMMAYDLPSTAK